MPTPKEIEKMRRNAALAQQGDFYVHEVVECVSSDDENCGKEDLPAAPDPATPAAPAPRAEAADEDGDERGGDDDEQRERWQWRLVEQRRAERAAERGGAPAAASASAPESVATTPGAPQPAAATPAKAASGGDYNQPD